MFNTGSGESESRCKRERLNKGRNEHRGKVRGRFSKLMTRRSWQDLSPVQKSANIIMALVEIVLVSLALRDIAHRPESEINGKKRTWVLTSLIQPVGPIIYFIFGRKSSKAPSRELLPTPGLIAS
jgi:hypothetical protein